MNHWNHRVVKRTFIWLEGTENEFTEDQYGIHEVYYDENGKVFAVTEEAIGPSGETMEELKESLEWITGALECPVLDYDNIPEDGATHPLDKAELDDTKDHEL